MRNSTTARITAKVPAAASIIGLRVPLPGAPRAVLQPFGTVLVLNRFQLTSRRDERPFRRRGQVAAARDEPEEPSEGGGGRQSAWAVARKHGARAEWWRARRRERWATSLGEGSAVQLALGRVTSRSERERVRRQPEVGENLGGHHRREDAGHDAALPPAVGAGEQVDPESSFQKVCPLRFSRTAVRWALRARPSRPSSSTKAAAQTSGAVLVPAGALAAFGGGAGTTSERNRAFGASTPKKRTRLTRGGGISAATRRRKSTGVNSRLVAPACSRRAGLIRDSEIALG